MQGARGENGGAVLGLGSVEIVGCSFTDMNPISGGIAYIGSTGTLRMESCVAVDSGAIWGSILFLAGSGSIYNCTFTDGGALLGGFVWMEADTALAINTTRFSNGASVWYGGAIGVQLRSVLDMYDCESFGM